jgi:gas vesicle protein GvpN
MTQARNKPALAAEPKQMAYDALLPEAGDDFVLTPEVAGIVDRALTYLRIGYPVHLAGPAGTGKTTLAFHLAAQLGRPVTLIHGNHEFGSSDLVGKEGGYRKSVVVDNFISSVLKTEENLSVHWNSNRLTQACERGATLIYDEFNRSRPEANNTLLSILEERILDLPRTGGRRGYLDVHPEFRAILTSNPAEYAGANKAPDALLDRLITINVNHYDRETELEITVAKSGIAPADAGFIVDLVRAMRELGPRKDRPTLRACIAMAKVLVSRNEAATPDNSFFLSLCRDILPGDILANGALTFDQVDQMVEEVYRALNRGLKRSGRSATGG